MKNLEIAKILYNIADILELQGVDFKPYAYRRAAQSIESLAEDIKDVFARGELRKIPGVGEAIAEKIAEIIKTGKLKYYEELKKDVKINLEELEQIPFLGPQKIKVLYKELKIKNLKELEKAILEHKVQKLAGFGEETEKRLWNGIQYLKTNPKRFLYAQALPIVREIEQKLGKLPFVDKFEVAGSFRRGKETIGDLDFLAVSSQPEKVMAAFVSMPDVREVLAKGATKSSVRLGNGLQVDLRVVTKKEFGSAMNYFIGSKEHNVELRKLALSKGYTLSEYGLFKLPAKEKDGKNQDKKWVAGRTEKEIYDKLGLQFIAPELRENMGEIAVAAKGKLPNLITVKDINGVFHNHTNWSDGDNTLLEMAQKAEELKFKFISFNDHLGPMGITNPLNEKRLKEYLKEIEKVRKKVGIRVFSGVEIDILKDGTLPLSSKLLRELDVVVASVHLAQNIPELEMTARICSALEKYPINILGHPTSRLLNEREEIAVNFEKVFDSAREREVFLEINSLPPRMDLNGEKVKAALDAGCKLALSTDAHSVSQMHVYEYGVLCARRGWAEKKDVLNCWSLPQIEKALRK